MIKNIELEVHEDLEMYRAKHGYTLAEFADLVGMNRQDRAGVSRALKSNVLVIRDGKCKLLPKRFDWLFK